MNIHNMMEDVLKSCMKDLAHKDEVLAKASEQQWNDIMAITLNQLPPKYVATSRGEIFSKTQLRAQVETDVYRELYSAMDRVLNTRRSSVFSDDSDSPS